MFITAVCVFFSFKLRWPNKNKINDKPTVNRKKRQRLCITLLEGWIQLSLYFTLFVLWSPKFQVFMSSEHLISFNNQCPVDSLLVQPFEQTAPFLYLFLFFCFYFWPLSTQGEREWVQTLPQATPGSFLALSLKRLLPLPPPPPPTLWPHELIMGSLYWWLTTSRTLRDVLQIC